MNYEQKTKNKKQKTFLYFFVLFCTFILAAFLRFYRLGQVPPSLDWDEVSLGYNAWSLLETGRDEFGNTWPLSIRSFGDYKPPLYTYLLIPSLVIFGRTEFAIRLPSAVAGVATVIITYFLVLEFFLKLKRTKFSEHSEDSESRNVKLSGNQNIRFSDPPNLRHTGTPSFQSFPNTLAIISAFLLAISPWHLQFSRIAFEANVALLFFVTGMWLLIRALKRGLPWSLLLSVVFMSLAMMSYHSLRLVVPVIVLGSLFVYGKEVWNLIRSGLVIMRPSLSKFLVPLVLSTILTILTILTIFYTTFFQGVGQSRFNETSFLTIDDLMTVSRQRIERYDNGFLDRLINHRFLVYAKQFVKGYLDHYSLKFWFIEGDNIDRHRTPGAGLLYWWELPVMVMGLMSLMGPMRLMETKEKLVIFLWFLAAPIASALTGGTPSAVRSLLFLPIPQIIVSIGLISLIRPIGRIRRILLVACCLLPVAIAFEVGHYFHQYYVHSSLEYASAWQFGYKQLVQGVMAEKDKYDRIIITTAYDQPYIYFLWYGNYNPKLWLNDGEFNKRFDKFEFKKIEWEQFSGQQRVLVVSSPEETKGKPVKWQVNFPDGRTAFNVTEL